jgi:hypothetical protein
VVVAARAVTESSGPAALLGLAAIGAGALAVAAVLIAFVFRQRLQRASHT